MADVSVVSIVSVASTTANENRPAKVINKRDRALFAGNPHKTHQVSAATSGKRTSALSAAITRIIVN